MKKVLHKLLTALTLILVLASCEDLTGLQGPRGENGKDGTNGIDGTNGTDGTDGLDGIVRNTAYAVSVALEEKTGGDDEPWTVTVSGVDISDPDAFRHLFNGIATGIEEGDIALDLSECAGATFAYTHGINRADKLRLVSIVLPASLAHIIDGSKGYGAFHDYTRLGSVSAPGLTYIGDYAFSGGPTEDLTEVVFPEVLRVGDYAFNCPNLSTISLPKAVSIGANAFIGDSSSSTLTAVDLPSARSIGDLAFYGWRSIASINLPEVESIGDSAFTAPGELMPNTTLIVLDLPRVKTIGNGVFANYQALTTVNLPELTFFDYQVFARCISLESLKLGPTVPTLSELIPTHGSYGIFFETGAGSIDIKVPVDKVSDYAAAGWKAIGQGADTTGTIMFGTNHKEITISTYE